MNKKYKLLLSSTLAGLATLPLIATVACGNGGNKGNQDGPVIAMNKQDEIVLEANTKTKDELEKAKWGTLNFATPNSTLAEDRNANEVKERNILGRPFSLHYHFNDLASWKAENDADSKYNKSSIPLQKRDWAEKVISTQQENKFDVLEGLSKNTSYTHLGTTNRLYSDDRLYSMWSDVNAFTEWGGSLSEGTVVVPKAEDINAAHKNGVPMYGTMFLPDGQGSPELYEQFISKSGNTYPAADKMIEMAKYYGFDGWFLNYETVTNNTQGVREFTKYLYDKSVENNLEVDLYNASVGYSLQQDNIYTSLALDYGDEITPGVDPKKAFYGYNTGEKGINEEAPFAKGNVYTYSYFGSHDPVIDDDDYDLKYHSSSAGNRDPRIVDGDSWKEVSKYYREKTVINGRNNFSTSFQIGFGKRWYDEGKSVPGGTKMFDYSANPADAGWRNIGIQSVLPTWRYINDEFDINNLTTALNRNGESVTPIVNSATNKKWMTTMKENAATYHGSASLLNRGDLAPNRMIVNKLYGANTTLKENDEFSVIYKNAGDDIKVDVAVWNKTNQKMSIIHSTETKDLGNGFKKGIFKINSANNNLEISSFGLAYSNESSSVKTVNTAVSQLSLNFDNKEVQPDLLSSLQDDGIFKDITRTDGEYKNVRLSWTTDKKVDHWAIFEASDDNYNRGKIIGLSANNTAFLQGLKNEDTKVLIIGYDGGGNTLIKQKAQIKMK